MGWSSSLGQLGGRAASSAPSCQLAATHDAGAIELFGRRLGRTKSDSSQVAGGQSLFAASSPAELAVARRPLEITLGDLGGGDL